MVGALRRSGRGHNDVLAGYWAKADEASDRHHPVIAHGLDVGAVCEVLLQTKPHLVATIAGQAGLEPSWLADRLPALVSLHDLGKLSVRFQGLRPKLVERLQGERLASVPPYSVKHDSLGYLLWTGHLAEAVLDHDLLQIGGALEDPATRRHWRRGLDVWFRAIAGHHGMPPTVVGPDRMTLEVHEHFDQKALDAAVIHARVLCDLLVPADAGTSPVEPPERQAWRVSSWPLAGLAVLSDWLGSADDVFRPAGRVDDPAGYLARRARPGARLAVVASGLVPEAPEPPRGFKELFPTYEPTPLQEAAQDLQLHEGAQLFILEDLTGSGKTEAALTLVNHLLGSGHAEGVYLALPTMATSNAMYERIAGYHRHLFTGVPNLVLAHGQRELSEPFTKSILHDSSGRDADDLPGPAACAAWIADHRKKALLAQVGVGTVDQALLAMLPVRHQSLRMAGLLGKVLVVDEVHAFDAYTKTLLEGLVAFQAATGGSTVLLSATLPMRMRQALVRAYFAGLRPAADPPMMADGTDPYPLLTHVGPAGPDPYPIAASPRAIRRVKSELVSPTKALEAVASAADAGRCVAWIRNTVDDAIASAAALRERLDPGRVTLFHARFTAADRNRIEKDVLARFGPKSGPAQRQGHVVVATQVLEQSLDLDFDEMFTDLAPIDLLLQRAGRLQRHARDANGTRLKPDGREGRSGPMLHIVSPDPVPDPSETWVRNALPGTAAVYRDHGALWLTARMLSERGGWSLPEDARALIEHVYGDDAASKVPPALEQATLANEGQAMTYRSIAAENRLRLVKGYDRGSSLAWDEDIVAPTRLGEPQVTLRLVHEVADGIEPLTPMDGPGAWAGSEVRVRVALLPDASNGEEQTELVARARPPMKDRGRWVRIVVLAPTSEARWSGKLPGKPSMAAVIHYDQNEGLTIERTTP